jgi:hypothetical protein
MSVILGQATVPSSSTVPAFTLPGGLCNFTVFQPTGPQPVYLGTSPNVSAANGMPVPVTPLSQECYNTVKGVTYYATTGSVTASTFHYIISTAT